jgi:hypothetical protein
LALDENLAVNVSKAQPDILMPQTGNIPHGSHGGQISRRSNV